MDISDNIIYIFIINKYLGKSCLYKTGTQFLKSGCLITCHNFRTGNYAITQTHIREIECILKDLHLRIHIRILRRIFNTLLDKIVKVDLPQRPLRRTGHILYTCNFQNKEREQRRKFRNRIQYNVYNQQRYRKQGKRKVRIQFKNSLWNKLPGKQYQDSRNNRLSQNNQSLVIYYTCNKRFQDNRHLQTVDHQRNIVSDQHRRYKLMRVPVKYIQNLTRQAFFLFVKFKT